VGGNRTFELDAASYEYESGQTLAAIARNLHEFGGLAGDGSACVDVHGYAHVGALQSGDVAMTCASRAQMPTHTQTPTLTQMQTQTQTQAQI